MATSGGARNANNLDLKQKVPGSLRQCLGAGDQQEAGTYPETQPAQVPVVLPNHVFAQG